MDKTAEQWIPAALALQLVGDLPGNQNERIAICTRAHAGLIKTRAELIIVGDDKLSDIVFPADFWWSEGHEALEQNWTTGDFATHVGKRPWQAFGVRFALDGLLQLLPVERRAIAAKSLSVVGKAEWLSALQARRFAYERAKINPSFAADAVLDACRLGYITGRAVSMRRANGDRPDDWTAQEREWDIPVWFWDHFTGSTGCSQNWERGIFSGRGRAPEGRCWITLTGVFFLTESLDVLLPHSGQASATEAPAPNPGGRPRKEFWDDLWCAVWSKAFFGDFKPKRQSEIERAMLDWAIANGHDVSESTVKPLARKMFAAMQDEGRNP